MEIIKKYAEAFKELEEFREENKKVLLKHFELEEKERIAKFTLIEKLKMIGEKNKKDIFWENKDLEIKLKNKRVTIFEKKRYAKK